jgi:outer membrane protein OmpA-like peptidoglycan-associated protein
MKKLIVLALATAIVVGAGPAFAAEMWDDMSWWGNTGATPEPVQDPARSGYWWWPTVPASNADDSELWGNRGIVYHHWTKPEPAVVEPPVAPQEPVAVIRETPVLNNVLFEFDSSVLSAEGQAEVNKLVSYMNEFPQDSVVLVGHTCNIGTDAYNMGLGQRRADSVKTYMVQQGIADARITTVSRGESEPAVPNDGPANRRLNRRAVFQVNIVN